MYRKTIGVYLFIILIVYLRKEIAGGALRLLYLFLNCKRVCSKFNMALKQKWTLLFFLKRLCFFIPVSSILVGGCTPFWYPWNLKKLHRWTLAWIWKKNLLWPTKVIIIFVQQTVIVFLRLFTTYYAFVEILFKKWGLIRKQIQTGCTLTAWGLPLPVVIISRWEM